SKMSQTLGMLVDAVVEEGDVLGVGQTTIFRAPARPVPGITVLQQALKDHSRDLTMSHEAIQVFVQIGVFVHLEIVQIGVFDFVLIQQRITPSLCPVTEHLFVERTPPPFDHAPFVNQTASELCQATAFGVHFAVDHFVDGHAERFTLVDYNLDLTGDARIHELVADLADVRGEQVAMTGEDSLVALIDDQMKIIDLHRITVPLAPEELDGFEWQFARFEIAHECAAEYALLPA